jgi:hypothetical protein
MTAAGRRQQHIRSSDKKRRMHTVEQPQRQ